MFSFSNLSSYIPIVHADNTAIEINSSELTSNDIGHYASGFLLTLTKADAPANLVDDLKPKLFRTQNPWIFQDDSYQKAVNNGAEVQYLVYETFFTANFANGVWPGDNGDWTIWENSVRTAVQKVLDAKMKVEYEIWNEPDYGYFWQRDTARFFETWKRGYQVIKQMDPNASIAGPSLSNYSLDYFSNFLNYAKANNVLPDTITWHELDRNTKYTQIDSRITEIKNWMTSNNIPYKRISINEIVPDLDLYHPGTLVDYLGILEVNQILSAHSCWDDSQSGGESNCWNSTLNGTISKNNKPRSTWWAYKYYAELTGKLLTLTFSNSNLGGLASANNETHEVKLLIGADTAGSNNITINYKSPWSSTNIKLEVDSYSLTDTSGAEVSEPIAKTQSVDYNPNGTTITVDGLGAYQAEYIKIIEVSKVNPPGSNSDANSKCSAEQIEKNNKCLPTVCKEDFNNDGQLSIIDFGVFISKYRKSGGLTLKDLATFAKFYKQSNVCI